MKRIFLLSGFILLFFCLSSCKKTADSTVPNPILYFTLQADSPLFTFGISPATPVMPLPKLSLSVVWNTATANVTGFVLNSQLGGTASTYTAPGLNYADLFSTTPASVNLTISKGDYTAATASIVFTATTGTVYPLILTGTYTDAADIATPVEFDLNDNLQVNAPVSNIIADGTQNFTIAVDIHLSNLPTNVTSLQFDTATLTNGIILINKTTNTGLYNLIKTNLVSSAGTVLTSVAK